MINRRSLITGLISFAAAPAIVRAANLMPVKAIKFDPKVALTEFITSVDYSGPTFDRMAFGIVRFDPVLNKFKYEWLDPKNVFISDHGEVTISDYARTIS